MTKKCAFELNVGDRVQWGEKVRTVTLVVHPKKTIEVFLDRQSYGAFDPERVFTLAPTLREELEAVLANPTAVTLGIIGADRLREILDKTLEAEF